MKPGDLITTKDYALELNWIADGYCYLTLKAPGNPQLQNPKGNRLHQIQSPKTDERSLTWKPGDGVGLLVSLDGEVLEVQLIGTSHKISIRHRDAFRSLQ